MNVTSVGRIVGNAARAVEGVVKEAPKVAPKGSIEAAELDSACARFAEKIRKISADKSADKPYSLNIKSMRERFDSDQIADIRRRAKAGNPLTQDEFQLHDDYSMVEFREAMDSLKRLEQTGGLEGNSTKRLPYKLRSLLGLV